MDNKDYFFCYNPYLSKHIQQNGVNCITVAINPASGNSFSLYRKTDKLQQAINSYKKLEK